MTELPTLTGKYLDLEPITPSHLPGLAVHYDVALSQFYPDPYVDVAAYYSSLMEEKKFGDVRIFVMRLKSTAEPVGCSGLFDYTSKHKRVEIGATWVGKAFQGTAVNVESKLLLMGYCFDTLGCNRVELKTDSLNLRSQAAMERLGFIKEGVHRNHMVRADGRIRHTVYYSVICEEWPKTRAHLESKLSARTKV